MPVNNQGFEYGVYPVLYGRFATGTFDHFLTPNIYPVSTVPPSRVTLISPAQGRRVPLRPTFVFDTPVSTIGVPLHFVIHLATLESFVSVGHTFDSKVSRAGWEYSTNGGTSYAPLPAGGVSVACRVRYTAQADIPIGSFYWRALANDGADYSVSYDTVLAKFGDRVVIRLKTPIKTTAYARSLVPVVMRSLATDGATPSQMKLFVTNNAFDANPTWEDASVVANGQGVAHTFSNATKTAADWGVDVRIELLANDSTGAISLDGFGFTFN